MKSASNRSAVVRERLSAAIWSDLEHAKAPHAFVGDQHPRLPAMLAPVCPLWRTSPTQDAFCPSGIAPKPAVNVMPRQPPSGHPFGLSGYAVTVTMHLTAIFLDCPPHCSSHPHDAASHRSGRGALNQE